MQNGLVSLVVLSVLAAALGQLVNENIERGINLETHLAVVTSKVTVRNDGSKAATGYKFQHDKTLADNLAYVYAQADDNEIPVTGNTVDIVIPAGESKTFEIIAVYTHTQEPFPKSITQAEKQLMRFKSNVYVTSDYETESQTTKFKLAGALESHTKVKPSSSSDNTITYGPYENVDKDAHKEVTVHFQSSTPFLTVTNLVREIVVSHWGYVYVTEDIDLLHSGATLKGAFSRLDYQRNPMAKQNAVAQFTTKLPAAAQDVYYRDVIGNISTSALRADDESVTVEITPRFPLFGGWKTHYTLGYILPAHEVLSYSGSHYQLKTSFIGHIYDNQVIDSAEVRVVLPEDVSDIQVDVPFSVEQSEESKTTYLDTSGRPVVVLRKSNLVEEHMEDMTIDYEFSSVLLLREPFMIVAFFLLLLVSAVMINKIDLSIEPQQKEKKE